MIEQRQRNLAQEEERIIKGISRLETDVQFEQNAINKLEEVRLSLNIFKHQDEYDEMTQRIAMRKLIDRIGFNVDGNVDVDVRYSWRA